MLENLSVVDFGVGLPAALVVRMLADAGAQTQRVEPASGDPFYGVYSAYPSWRRDTRISHAETIESAIASAADALRVADICVIGGEDFPGLHWKPDAETLAQTYPNLVVLEINGFPSGMAEAGTPAVDLLVQASSGLVYEQYSDRPMLLAFPAPSYGAALEGLVAVLAALVDRQRTGKGQIVRTSLFEGTLSWLGHSWFISEHRDRSIDFVIPKDVHPLIFQCADGKYIHFTMGTTNARANIYGLLGINDPTVADDPRGLPSLARGVRNFYGDVDLLQSYVGTWRRQDLLAKLWALGVPAEAVNGPGEGWDDEQVAYNGTICNEPDGGRRVGLPFRIDLKGTAASATTETPTESSGEADAAPNAPPLSGVRIIDFGNFTAGPHASMILADLGANVIKVEALAGDPIRGFYRPYSTSSRGKRNLALDMKQPAGLEIALRLCRTADMVHHNFRPGVTQRLGIDLETLHAMKPELIILENSGYGASGPKSQSGGIDMIFQAFCGHEQHAAGNGNTPISISFASVDFATGVVGAIAALIAQLCKAETGDGAAIATSLLDTGLFLLSEVVQSKDGSFLPLPVLNQARTGIHPAEQLYQTGDGWIAIAARGEAMARGLLSVLNLPTRITAPHNVWGADEAATIAAAIAQWESAPLLAALQAGGVWAASCRSDGKAATLHAASLRENGTVLATRHPRYGEVLQPGRLFSLSRSTTTVTGVTAALGEHSREILAELGYGEAEIAKFYLDGVVAG